MPRNPSLWENTTRKTLGILPVLSVLTRSLACPYQSVVSGFFNYPLYLPLFNGFGHTDVSLAPLPTITQSLVTNHCSDPSILGTFFENHDLTRFWNLTSDLTLG